MIKITTSASPLFFVCLFVLHQFLVPNFAQIAEPEHRRTDIRPFKDLSVEILTTDQNCLPLQPISIIVRQNNTKTERVLGYERIGFDKSPLSVAVRKSGTDRWAWISTSPISKLTKYTGEPIEPGTRSESKEWISLGLGKYFPVAGSYEIKAVLASPDGLEFVESNILTINVIQPASANRAAYDLIRNSGYEDFLFSGAEFERVKDTLDLLKSRHPTSPYAQSATFILGETYFHRRQYALALSNLLLLENRNEFVLVDRVRHYLAEIRRVNVIPQKETGNL